MTDKQNVIRKVLAKARKDTTNETQVQDEAKVAADKEMADRAEQERVVAAERASGVGPAVPPEGISKLGKPAVRASLAALADRLEKGAISSSTPVEEMYAVARELRKLADH